MDLGRGGGGVVKVKEEVMRTAAEQRLRLWTWPAPTAEEEQATACVGNRTKLHIRAWLLCCGHLPEAAPGAACSKHGSRAQEPQRHGAAQWGRAVGQGGLGGLGGFWGAPGGSRGCLWPSTAVTSSPGHALAPVPFSPADPL